MRPIADARRNQSDIWFISLAGHKWIAALLNCIYRVSQVRLGRDRLPKVHELTLPGHDSQGDFVRPDLRVLRALQNKCGVCSSARIAAARKLPFI